MILDLHQQGLTVSAISRETGIDRKTVRKYIERGLEVPLMDRESLARRLSIRLLHTCGSG
ncbi:UNVERIFIED_ORG: transposase [Rhizobium etli]